MPQIRIPREHWGEVWFTLVESGPISRYSKELVYVVSDRQVRLLRRKKLPFELLTPGTVVAPVQQPGSKSARMKPSKRRRSTKPAQ